MKMCSWPKFRTLPEDKTIKTETTVLNEHHKAKWKHYTIFPSASTRQLPVLPLVNPPKRKECIVPRGHPHILIENITAVMKFPSATSSRGNLLQDFQSMQRNTAWSSALQHCVVCLCHYLHLNVSIAFSYTHAGFTVTQMKRQKRRNNVRKGAALFFTANLQPSYFPVLSHVLM